MWALLVLVLGSPPVAPFVVQLASECPAVATNSSLELALLFNRIPLVWVDPQKPPKFAPSPGGGPLSGFGAELAAILNRDPRWGRRLREKGEVCAGIDPKAAPKSAPPKIRLLPSATGKPQTPLLLTCHVWGFYPPELSLAWLKNGLLLDPPNPPEPPQILPAGSWSYRSEGRLELSPPQPGDRFGCLVRHPGLEEPLLEEWAPGLSPKLSLLVFLATLAMILGLLLFGFGLWKYLKKPQNSGYTPLPGDNCAGSI